MRKLIATLIVIVLVGVPAFAQGTSRAFDPQSNPPAPVIRLSSSSPDKAPSQPQADPAAQRFQQLLLQLTQGQG